MAKLETIKFFSGGYQLHGVLHLPDRLNPPVVIGCHGLLADSNSPKQTTLAQRCCEKGIAYFRFDHRGCGKSQGDFKKVTTLSARCIDLKSAIDFVFNKIDSKHPVGLFGSSMGGAVCLSVASEMETGPIVVVAAPIRTIDLAPPTPPEGNKSGDLSDNFFKNNLTFDLQDRLVKINNILIFHGDMDSVVPVFNARQLYDRAGNPKKIVIQKGGDHTMSNTNDQKIFQAKALDWIQKGFEKS